MLTAMPARSNSLYTTSVGIKPQPDGIGGRVANGYWRYQSKGCPTRNQKKWSGHWGGMLALKLLVRSKALQEHEIVRGQVDEGTD